MGGARSVVNHLLLAAVVVRRKEGVNRLDRLALVRSRRLDVQCRTKTRAKNQYADDAAGVGHFSTQPADDAGAKSCGELGDAARPQKMNPFFPWNNNDGRFHLG